MSLYHLEIDDGCGWKYTATAIGHQNPDGWTKGYLMVQGRGVGVMQHNASGGLDGVHCSSTGSPLRNGKRQTGGLGQSQAFITLMQTADKMMRKKIGDCSALFQIS